MDDKLVERARNIKAILELCASGDAYTLGRIKHECGVAATTIGHLITSAALDEIAAIGQEQAAVQRGCGMIDCVNECGGDYTWATCPHALSLNTSPEPVSKSAESEHAAYAGLVWAARHWVREVEDATEHWPNETSEDQQFTNSLNLLLSITRRLASALEQAPAQPSEGPGLRGEVERLRRELDKRIVRAHAALPGATP